MSKIMAHREHREAHGEKVKAGQAGTGAQNGGRKTGKGAGTPGRRGRQQGGGSQQTERAKQARIEMEFIGPTEELGKLLFALFQAHELKTGHAKAIARDAKIELLPMRTVKGMPSVVVLLTIGSGVPVSLASNYLWHRCETFSKSREVKILINRTEYVYNEHELKKIIKTTIEKETEQK